MPVFNRISGGGLILDATALPSDVASGKIFYNNDGKQIGTNEISSKYKQKIFSFRAGDTVTATAICKNASASLDFPLYLDDKYGELINFTTVDTEQSMRYAVSEKINARYITMVSIIYNGVTYDLNLYETSSVIDDGEDTARKIYDKSDTPIRISQNVWASIIISRGMTGRRSTAHNIWIGAGFSDIVLSEPEEITTDFDVIYTYVE